MSRKPNARTALGRQTRTTCSPRRGNGVEAALEGRLCASRVPTRARSLVPAGRSCFAVTSFRVRKP
jgi:hypothetical protein